MEKYLISFDVYGEVDIKRHTRIIFSKSYKHALLLTEYKVKSFCLDANISMDQVDVHEPELYEKFIEHQDHNTDSMDFIEYGDVDRSVFTHIGSMNHIVQLKYDNKTNNACVDQYQPRRNTVWSGDIDIPRDEMCELLKENIERMKLYINLQYEFILGYIDDIYYWEYENRD